MSVHNAVREEVEPSILKTIEMTALAFRQQETPPTFSCALQAKFLENILQEYTKVRRDKLTSITSPNESFVKSSTPTRPASGLNPQPILGIFSPQRDTATYNEHVPTFSQHVNEIERNETIGNDNNQTDLEILQEQRFQQVQSPQSLSGEERQGDNESVGTIPQNFFFGDKQWANMFINAGFNEHDGVFLPG